MTARYKIHTRYKTPARHREQRGAKAGASNFISISMLADGKAPPAPSYYGIIGKSERGVVASEARDCASWKDQKKRFSPRPPLSCLCYLFPQFDQLLRRIQYVAMHRRRKFIRIFRRKKV